MYLSLASRIMPRTTLDIDPVVLKELKRRGLRDGRSLGQVASELLAGVLRSEEPRAPAPLQWRRRRMGPRVDLEDKDALHRALDGR